MVKELYVVGETTGSAITFMAPHKIRMLNILIV
jgi:hypothetical protein